MALGGIVFLEGIPVRKSFDNKYFVGKVKTVELTLLGNHTYVAKREIICFIIMQPCHICKP